MKIPHLATSGVRGHVTRRRRHGGARRGGHEEDRGARDEARAHPRTTAYPVRARREYAWSGFWYRYSMDVQPLLQTPRWAALTAFVRRWYAEPLGAAVVTEDDLARTEAHLGCKMPPALREWFLVVGHRLQFCGQDDPTRLEDLAGEVATHESWRAKLVAPDNGRIVVWRENQGCWFAEVEVDSSGTDGTALLTADRGRGGRRERLEQALLGIVCSDTLVAVWAGNAGGPLGRLKRGVVGGYPLETTPKVKARVACLPVLDFPNTPSYGGPFRGHESLIIRESGGGWEWMAADEDAHAEANRILGLDEDGGPRRLVVVFDPLPPSARPALQAWVDARFPLAVGRLAVAHLPPDLRRAWVEFDTNDPDATLQDLLARLPAEAATSARAGHRSEGTTRFVACWPHGSQEFVYPLAE